jgi:hypothetical protein
MDFEQGSDNLVFYFNRVRLAAVLKIKGKDKSRRRKVSETSISDCRPNLGTVTGSG